MYDLHQHDWTKESIEGQIELYKSIEGDEAADIALTWPICNSKFYHRPAALKKNRPESFCAGSIQRDPKAYL